MAIYHCRVKVQGRRLKGVPKPGGATRRSAIAAAAYRSGERLYDIALGKWFEFEKPDVVHTEIMIPPDAEVGDWVKDRASLWNMVEKAELRVDSQFAREIEISLPRELTHEQRVALVRSYVAEHFVSQGMVADIAIHNPKGADYREQPHAHVLLTLRRLDATTNTGFSKDKERDWNERPEVFREVADARKRHNITKAAAERAQAAALDARRRYMVTQTEPDRAILATAEAHQASADARANVDKELLETAEAKRNIMIWRKGWADACNKALEEAGSEARVDHRTLEKQGIMRLPEIALGIARHIEKAYEYLRERVTQWVGIRKRASLYEEVEAIRDRDPVELIDFLNTLHEKAEDFAAQFRKRPDRGPPEAPLDR